MFARSAITPPKVNWFGWNREHSENINDGWLWQILGAIRLVATVWEASEILFLFVCPLNNARFHRQWLQIAGKLILPSDPPYTGCLISIFIVKINSQSFPWAVRSAINVCRMYSPLESLIYWRYTSWIIIIIIIITRNRPKVSATSDVG